MVKKYAAVRFPIEAYPKLVERRNKIIDQLNKMCVRKYYKEKRCDVPFTKILKVAMDTPLEFSNDQLYSMFGKRKRGNPYAK